MLDVVKSILCLYLRFDELGTLLGIDPIKVIFEISMLILFYPFACPLFNGIRFLPEGGEDSIKYDLPRQNERFHRSGSQHDKHFVTILC